MRTTLTIDDDVLAAARALAEAQGTSIGEALSTLARAALTARAPARIRNGILLLPSTPGAGRATLADVNALRDHIV